MIKWIRFDATKSGDKSGKYGYRIYNEKHIGIYLIYLSDNEFIDLIDLKNSRKNYNEEVLKRMFIFIENGNIEALR